MSLLAWNCRGLGNPRTIRFLRDTVHQIKPSFIFLSEILTNKNTVTDVCKRLDFAGCWVVESQGHSGGLALFWKNEGSCIVTEGGTHFIDFEIESEHVGRWRYTGFYGCPERARRRESWNLMYNLANKSNLPWCIIGDFNDLMFADEKRGGQMHPRALLSGFTEVVNDCRLVDLGYVGDKFT